MKYLRSWERVAWFILLLGWCLYADAFPRTVYQCPAGVTAFIVYYMKDGQIISIVGASGASYLACQGENCLHDQARQAELIIYNDAKIVDNARVVDLNTVCN